MNEPAFLRAVALALLLSVCTSPQPTGTIAFSSDRDGDAETYIFEADRTGLERLTYGPTADTNAVRVL